MSEDQSTTTMCGNCLCGAVAIHLQHDKPTMSACHCSICRRWTGGPFMALECHKVPRIEGIEHVHTYPSSEWAERGFCSRCGTHLFYRLIKGDLYAVPVGLFSEGANWPFDLQIFVDEKPDNYQFANDTQTMTGEEVFKAWSP